MITVNDVHQRAAMLRHWMNAMAPQFAPKNVLSIKWRSWLGAVPDRAMELTHYQTAAEGRVVHSDHKWAVVRVTPSNYFVVDSELLDRTVALGDRVRMTPPAPLRFDGKALNGEQDPANGAVRTYMLTERVRLPVWWPHSEDAPGRSDESEGRWPVTELLSLHLKQLVEQLEEMPQCRRTRDGRSLLGAIADERPTALRFIEPGTGTDAYKDRRQWASIEWDFPPGHALRTLAIRYNRGTDYYEIDTVASDGTEATAKDVCFEALEEAVYPLVVSPGWNRVTVELIEPAKKRKAA